MRKDCYLRQKILEAESGISCFSAKKGRAPGSWEELAAEPYCGAYGIPRDWRGRPLVMQKRGEAIVITDADGDPGGGWLVCGPGLVGVVIVLLMALGAGAGVIGVVKKARLLVLIGVVLIVAGLIVNSTGPIE